MSERLRNLQRQQALLREHLAWLDGELAREARESSHAIAPEANATLTPSTSALTASPVGAQDFSPDADALIERYASSDRQNPADLRRGCLLIFSAVLFLIIMTVAIVWLVYYR
jgi:hypothetical protein